MKVIEMFILNTNNPFDLFNQWFEEAKKSEINDPNAMSLATVGAGSKPSVRIVLMKNYDKDGFVFYTNLTSRKGSELTQNPHASVVFHWKTLAKQIRIDGITEAVSEEEADEYFQTRARISQIGAWASKQSQPLTDRDQLLEAVKRFETKYHEKQVPRPTHWSGLRLKPTRIEFWQDAEYRLHDRFIFDKISDKDDWTITRLSP